MIEHFQSIGASPSRGWGTSKSFHDIATDKTEEGQKKWSPPRWRLRFVPAPRHPAPAVCAEESESPHCAATKIPRIKKVSSVPSGKIQPRPSRRTPVLFRRAGQRFCRKSADARKCAPASNPLFLIDCILIANPQFYRGERKRTEAKRSLD